MRALLLQTLLAIVWPTGPSIKIEQTTVGDVHECRIGVGAVGTEDAGIATRGNGSVGMTQVLRKGQLLVACGVLYRLHEPVHEPDTCTFGMTGPCGRAVVLDLTPPRKPVLHRGTIVLTLGGDAGPLGPRRVFLRDLSFARTRRGLSARFTVLDKAETAVAGVAGDVITIGPERYRVVSVLPPSARTGVPGWVELAATPAR